MRSSYRRGSPTAVHKGTVSENCWGLSTIYWKQVSSLILHYWVKQHTPEAILAYQLCANSCFQCGCFNPYSHFQRSVVIHSADFSISSLSHGKGLDFYIVSFLLFHTRESSFWYLECLRRIRRIHLHTGCECSLWQWPECPDDHNHVISHRLLIHRVLSYHNVRNSSLNSSTEFVIILFQSKTSMILVQSYSSISVSYHACMLVIYSAKINSWRIKEWKRDSWFF